MTFQITFLKFDSLTHEFSPEILKKKKQTNIKIGASIKKKLIKAIL